MVEALVSGKSLPPPFDRANILPYPSKLSELVHLPACLLRACTNLSAHNNNANQLKIYSKMKIEAKVAIKVNFIMYLSKQR